MERDGEILGNFFARRTLCDADSVERRHQLDLRSKRIEERGGVNPATPGAPDPPRFLSTLDGRKALCPPLWLEIDPERKVILALIDARTAPHEELESQQPRLLAPPILVEMDFSGQLQNRIELSAVAEPDLISLYFPVQERLIFLALSWRQEAWGYDLNSGQLELLGRRVDAYAADQENGRLILTSGGSVQAIEVSSGVTLARWELQPPLSEPLVGATGDLYVIDGREQLLRLGKHGEPAQQVALLGAGKPDWIAGMAHQTGQLVLGQMRTGPRGDARFALTAVAHHTAQTPFATDLYQPEFLDFGPNRPSLVVFDHHIGSYGFYEPTDLHQIRRLDLDELGGAVHGQSTLGELLITSEREIALWRGEETAAAARLSLDGPLLELAIHWPHRQVCLATKVLGPKSGEQPVKLSCYHIDSSRIAL